MFTANRRAAWMVCAGWVGLVTLFVVLLVIALEVRIWPLELLHHFVIQYVLASFFVFIAFASIKRPFSAVLALFLVVGFATDYLQAPRPVSDHALLPLGQAHASNRVDHTRPSRHISLITYNMLVANQRPDDLADWLAKTPAEVIVMQETPPGLVPHFANMKDIYPYQLIVEPGAHIGSEIYGGTEIMAILSRYPIAKHDVLRPAGQGKLVLLARLDVTNAESPWIVVAHPTDPVSTHGLKARDQYLSAMADAVSRLDGPVVVAGDFNTTPYAPIFETFLNTARVSTFHDFPATFPAALGGLGIPIDHILVRDAELADLASVGSIGSDHRPLRALVKLPRKLAATATNDKTG